MRLPRPDFIGSRNDNVVPVLVLHADERSRLDRGEKRQGNVPFDAGAGGVLRLQRPDRLDG